MILIPLEYLKKYLFLPSLALSEIAEKLTYAGLETNLVEKNQQVYLEINPLPNRVDLSCWRGIVQEIKILLNCTEKSLSLPLPKPSEKEIFSVSIASKSCLTFGLGLIKNVEVKTSPTWLQEWLAVNQIPPVNNLVDSINLARLEAGQSLRIYDYDILATKKRIVVEKAGQKETIQLLSGKETTLNSEDIVVRADREIISLAGITETRKASCTESTKNILVEWSSFNLPQLKKTTHSSLPPFFLTETLPSFVSSHLNPHLTPEILFTYQNLPNPPLIIKLSLSFLAHKIGQILPTQQIEKIWSRLGFDYSKKGEIYSITVPFHRSDLKEPEDLLEELLRIYDYNQVISSEPL